MQATRHVLRHEEPPLEHNITGLHHGRNGIADPVPYMHLLTNVCNDSNTPNTSDSPLLLPTRMYGAHLDCRSPRSTTIIKKIQRLARLRISVYRQ
jgi:hypothetical protein